jgi:hypothetical protein
LVSTALLKGAKLDHEHKSPEQQLPSSRSGGGVFPGCCSSQLKLILPFSFSIRVMLLHREQAHSDRKINLPDGMDRAYVCFCFFISVI